MNYFSQRTNAHNFDKVTPHNEKKKKICWKLQFL